MPKTRNNQKKTYGHQERDEELRAEFKQIIERVAADKLVYVDEAGIDNRQDYAYGYSKKGTRCYAFKSGKRAERISWICALKGGYLKAPFTFEVSCNKNCFKQWLAQSLLPQLELGDLIILDNATFHKGEELKKLVEEAGCQLLYLPPYSPDLNPIERWWAVLKLWMKKKWKEFDNLKSCVDSAFNACPKVIT